MTTSCPRSLRHRLKGLSVLGMTLARRESHYSRRGGALLTLLVSSQGDPSGASEHAGGSSTP